MKRRRVFWAGDSTVKYNRFDTYPQTGIGQVAGLYFKPDVVVFDYGENGRSSKSFYDEGRLDEIASDLSAGDFLFIQFGHNDEKRQDPSRYTEPYGSYQEYLMLYVDAARSRGAYPVLLTPIARRRFDEQGNFHGGTHGDYPDAMRQLASKEQIPLIDLTEKSDRLLKEAGMEKTLSWFMHIAPGEYPGTMYEAGQADDTHLKYEGAVVMAGLVAEGLQELGGIYGDLLYKADR